MEDMPMESNTNISPVVERDAGDRPVHTVQLLTTYESFPESPQDESLLNASSSSQIVVAASVSDAASINPPVEGMPDYGEAPPYFEVVDTDATRVPSQSENVVATEGLPLPESSRRSSRLSMSLRHLFTPWSNVTTRSSELPTSFNPRSTGHVRNNLSMTSTSSPPASPARERNTPRPSHHHNSSNGSGFANIWRTDSRQRSIHTVSSQNRLASQSMISLNSISAPLSHTLVRSDVSLSLHPLEMLINVSFY